MTDANHDGPPPVSEVVHIQTPVWNRAMFAVAIVLAAATAFLFALGSWQGGSAARREAAALKMQVDKFSSVSQCRSQRQSDLNAINSDMVSGIVDMVIALSDRQPPEAYAPIKANLKLLQANRAAVKQQAVTAVQDCQG